MRVGGPVMLFTFFTALAVAGLWSDEAHLAPFRKMLEYSAFPENGESRRLLQDLIMAPAYPMAESPFRILRQRSDGRLVQFELRRGLQEWYLIFRSQRGEEPREEYPLWGRGTWIIKKDLFTGDFIQAKIFLQDSEESFIRLFPNGDNRSHLDIHLFGRQLGNDVILPIPFRELLLVPFAQILSTTDHAIDWGLVFPDPRQLGYRRVESFVRELGIYSDRIVEIDDAAIDGGGRNVFIETGEELPADTVPPGLTGLNCSGYVKWIADGLYSAWGGVPGGKYLDIELLKKPTSRKNWNSWSESMSAAGSEARDELGTLRDPHFGVNWNRNLAYRIESARIRRELSPEEKQVLNTGPLFGIPHRRDMGYQLEDLASALHQLAAMQPGSVYLAAINSRFVPDAENTDSDPLPLHQYWHVLLLAPWFEDGGDGGEKGSFHVAVLDTGDVAESLLKVPGAAYKPRFLRVISERAIRYAKLGEDDSGNALVPEVMVHLVRVELPPNFQAPPLPEAH